MRRHERMRALSHLVIVSLVFGAVAIFSVVASPRVVMRSANADENESSDGAIPASTRLCDEGEPVPLEGEAKCLVQWRIMDVARDGEPPPPLTPVLPESPAGLQVWSDGDSLSYFMTTNLFEMFRDQGGIPVRSADYKISARLRGQSGRSEILGVPFNDWFSYMPAEMARYAPDVVVLMVGANDAGYIAPELYGQDVGAMMDLVKAPGRIVAWVGLPGLLREDLARNSPPLNVAAKAEADLRDWVVFVDTSRISPDASDGVHFGPSRARLLAQTVMEALFPAAD